MQIVAVKLQKPRITISIMKYNTYKYVEFLWRSEEVRLTKWRRIGVSKSKRGPMAHSTKRKVGSCGGKMPDRSGRWHSVQGFRRAACDRLAQHIGSMNKPGCVKVVCLKRRGERTANPSSPVMRSATVLDKRMEFRHVRPSTNTLGILPMV